MFFIFLPPRLYSVFLRQLTCRLATMFTIWRCQLKSEPSFFYFKSQAALLIIVGLFTEVGIIYCILCQPILIYGIKISDIDGEVYKRLDKHRGTIYADMFGMFYAWRQEAAKLENGEITKEEYDQWRYRYPEFDITRKWVKVPSQ